MSIDPTDGDGQPRGKQTLPNPNLWSPTRQPFFEQLGVTDAMVTNQFNRVGKGGLIWLHRRPVEFSASPEGAMQIVAATKRPV